MSWQDNARCKGQPPNVFHPSMYATKREKEAIKAICRLCPVRVQCLDYALDNEEMLGVWGGMMPHERRKLLVREHKTRWAPPPTECLEDGCNEGIIARGRCKTHYYRYMQLRRLYG